MLMSWLSNVVWLEFPTLPKDLVNNLVLNIGNSFLNLGILVPAEVKADADSVIEVKYCHDGLIFSPPNQFCSGWKAVSLATSAEYRG